MISGFFLMTIFVSAGIAVDYSNLYSNRSKMQNAADAAALMAALQVELTESEREKLALTAFKSNYQAHPPISFKLKMVGDRAVVDTTVNVPLALLGIIGKTNHDISVNAEAETSGNDLEVVLVLDISGSMRAGLGSPGKQRIAVLKESANLLLDKLKAVGGGTVKVGVVPFTMNVNIGAKRTGMVRDENDALFAGTKWKGCVFEQSRGDYVADNPGRKFSAWIYPPLPDAASGTNQCRVSISDGTNSGFATLTEAASSGSLSAQFDGPNRNCVRHEILPLTNNIRKVRNHIDSLTAEGNDGTVIGPGVTWGLRMLSPRYPLKQAKSWSSNVDKIMIVLTDGEQTTEAEFQTPTCQMVQNSSEKFEFNPGDHGLKGKVLQTYGPKDNLTPYGFILDSNPFGTNPTSWDDVRTDLETISLAACSEAKKKRSGRGIEVYSIGVSNGTAPGTGVHRLLANCASGPDKHFYAPTADALETAFNEIAKRITRIRLTN